MPGDLPRTDSLYSLPESEVPSSHESSPNNHSPSPPRSICSDLHGLEKRTRNIDVNQDNVDIPFDVIVSLCDTVGQYLAALIERCRVSVTPSPFDAATEPKISLACYFERIRHYSQASPETIVCATVLIHRIMQTGLHLTNYNCHRLLVSAIMVFAKFYDDEIDSNARWARIAGVKKVEINNLEVEFLNRCQFDLRVSPEDFHDMVHQISDFKNNPQNYEHAETELSEAEAPAPKNHVWSSFHVRGDKKAVRTKSFHYEKQHSQKSIMSFFHQTNHAHLNRFPRTNCSPSSMNLASPGSSTSGLATPEMGPSKGLSRSVSAYGLSPADSVDSASSRKSRTLPRGPSLQNIAAFLQHASPFVSRPKEARSVVFAQGY